MRRFSGEVHSLDCRFDIAATFIPEVGLLRRSFRQINFERQTHLDTSTWGRGSEVSLSDHVWLMLTGWSEVQ